MSSHSPRVTAGNPSPPGHSWCCSGKMLLDLPNLCLSPSSLWVPQSWAFSVVAAVPMAKKLQLFHSGRADLTGPQLAQPGQAFAEASPTWGTGGLQLLGFWQHLAKDDYSGERWAGKALTHPMLGSWEGAGDRCPAWGFCWGRAGQGGGSPAGTSLALPCVGIQPSAPCASSAQASFMLMGRIWFWHFWLSPTRNENTSPVKRYNSKPVVGSRVQYIFLHTFIIASNVP